MRNGDGRPAARPACVARRALGAAALLVAACAATDGERDELAAIDARHAEHLERFERLQASFARANPVPREIDLGPRGTILVHEALLQGYPGREELRLVYTWVNTTARPVERVDVAVALRDPERGLAASERQSLALPFGVRFSADSSYTTFVHVPAADLVGARELRYEIAPEVEFSRP